MERIFETMVGTYRQEGDYLLPNVEAPESPQIGIWGQHACSTFAPIRECYIPPC